MATIHQLRPPEQSLADDASPPRPAAGADANCAPLAGAASPIGATVERGGVNFCVFSRDASELELLLFDHENDQRPSRAVRVAPSANRSYHY